MRSVLEQNPYIVRRAFCKLRYSLPRFGSTRPTFNYNNFDILTCLVEDRLHSFVNEMSIIEAGNDDRNQGVGLWPKFGFAHVNRKFLGSSLRQPSDLRWSVLASLLLLGLRLLGVEPIDPANFPKLLEELKSKRPVDQARCITHYPAHAGISNAECMEARRESPYDAPGHSLNLLRQFFDTPFSFDCSGLHPGKLSHCLCGPACSLRGIKTCVFTRELSRALELLDYRGGLTIVDRHSLHRIHAGLQILRALAPMARTAARTKKRFRRQGCLHQQNMSILISVQLDPKTLKRSVRNPLIAELTRDRLEDAICIKIRI
ncbi:hypothetical protein WJ95_01615 [Burkholderia ubonensis]|nr:hypothetical protein WJ95_01615 [Burkholderia ubonensis]KVT29253.1 hypothetical protein WK48_15620 [Burkholderia ubonensis]KVW71630.1 hypothetical protein WK99_06445 [Burkholderia ubonensis]KWI36349.1 hypothetical protein WM04_06850 [Burkholderia ubonensis]KWK62742.1 hypothetical protein WM15_01815 [Burkholderia ubonensis]